MNKKGFTLTELIVVIVIIGLVLLIVIPVSSNIMQNNAEEKGKFYVQTLEMQLILIVICIRLIM